MERQQFMWTVVPGNRMREQEDGGRVRQGRAECVLELVTTLDNTACFCRGPCEEPCGPLYLTYIAMEVKVKVKSLSHVQLCDPWTAAYQASRSMGFSRQEYWSGLPLPSNCCTVSHCKTISKFIFSVIYTWVVFCFIPLQTIQQETSLCECVLVHK